MSRDLLRIDDLRKSCGGPVLFRKLLDGLSSMATHQSINRTVAPPPVQSFSEFLKLEYRHAAGTEVSRLIGEALSEIVNFLQGVIEEHSPNSV